MATIIQGGPDLRHQALEQGVSKGVEGFFAARKKKEQEQKFLTAFRIVNEATSYDDAVQKMGTIDRDILSNPAALEMLSKQIDRKFPAQEAVQVDTPQGVQTKAVREGDVAGAISQAQQAGGRLTRDVEVERGRAADTLKEGFEKEKLKLEERRTAADELRARASARKAQQGPKPGQKEIEIQLLMQQGVPLDRATRLAYGHEKIDIVPETGEARLSDAVSGRVSVVPVEMLDNPEQIPKPREGESLWDAAKYATGPFSALRQAWALPGSYMGVFVPEKTIEGRQRLSLSTQKLIRVLAANPRYASMELERIRKELSLSPNVFVHPEVLRRRMVTVDQELQLWLAQDERDSRDMSLPAKERAESKKTAAEIRNFLSELSVPREHVGRTIDPIQDLPPQAQGVFTPEEWQRLTAEEQAEWLRQ